MLEWVLRIPDQDRQEGVEIEAGQRVYTTAPRNLFQIVHARLDRAISTTSGKVIIPTE